MAYFNCVLLVFTSYKDRVHYITFLPPLIFHGGLHNVPLSFCTLIPSDHSQIEIPINSTGDGIVNLTAASPLHRSTGPLHKQ